MEKLGLGQREGGREIKAPYLPTETRIERGDGD